MKPKRTALKPTRNPLFLAAMLGLAPLPLIAGVDDVDAPPFDRSQLAFFQPLPPHAGKDGQAPDEKMVTLGRQLFFESRISLNGEMSCNSCHTLDAYGVDHRPFSPGVKGELGGRNSPTVYNAAFHLAQFWDGRAADVEEQAKGPILNPVEMAMPAGGDVETILRSIPGYVASFGQAFPGENEPVNYDNLGRAIGAFERTLTTPGRFDKFLAGDDAALAAGEKQGLAVFVRTGCVACHSGPALGGHLYQKLGVVKPWPHLKDEGRSAVTGNEAEKFFFKVPSLRNIAETAPFFHDGSTPALGDAVTMMAEHQLGQKLSKPDADAIVAFLKALTGDLPKERIAKPELPADGAETPALMRALREKAVPTPPEG